MHSFIRQWPLELILGQLESTAARGCGGRRLWSLPSQREKDRSDSDGNYCYATDDATHDGACI
jgi:hypothetical protein